MRFFLHLFFWIAGYTINTLAAQHPLLQAGPMLGYVEMREALLWAQTNQSATVQFEYWPAADASAPHQFTAKKVTEKATVYTAKCVVEDLEPGVQYNYTLYINGEKVNLPYPTLFSTQSLWQWRTDPPAFAVATGSCNYVNETPYDRPGKPYGGDQKVFTAINAQKPNVMLWLGDNTYLREVDWMTRSGMAHRYTHTRSTPELQPLLASAHHYAIWDDHDYGPNNSDATWSHKDDAWDLFQAFWGNPTFGVSGQKGCTSWFQYTDIEFFMLDNRYFRTPNFCKTCPRTMLGEAQLTWFKAALAASRAPFKIVALGGQLLTNAYDETYINVFPAERDSILNFIERENIKGVVFVTGDPHYAELSALKNGAGNMVYELTTSPLTAGVNTNVSKIQNNNRVEGTAVAQNNFAMLRFSGPRTARQLEISLYGNDGQVLWTKTVKAGE
jgi:alkaline phosphatase D